MPHDVPYTRTERYETIIIGWGRAALAAACELQKRDVDCLVLRTEGTVRSLRRAGAHLEILTDELRYEASSVVVAMGRARSPIDLRSVEGDPGLHILGDVARDAVRIAERIAAAGP